MLFPAISFKKKFKMFKDDSWKTSILLLIFNIFDTLGKYIQRNIKTNIYTASGIVILRLIFKLDLYFFLHLLE